MYPPRTTLYGVGNEQLKTVKSKLTAFFSDYMKPSCKPTSSASSSTSSSCAVNEENVPTLDFMDVLQEFDHYERKEYATSKQKTQLELYLEEKKLERTSKFDILSYWKAHQIRYPKLANMARDVPSVLISTVASQSAFSSGGRVLDEYRSVMKPEVVEALICCKDWLFGQKELQI